MGCWPETRSVVKDLSSAGCQGGVLCGDDVSREVSALRLDVVSSSVLCRL